MDSTAGRFSRATLGIEASWIGDELVVRCRGEMDFATRDKIEREVMLLASSNHPRVVHIVTTEVGFCDSAGFGGLIRLARRLHARGVELRVTPSRQIARMSGILGIDDLIGIPAEERLRLPRV